MIKKVAEEVAKKKEEVAQYIHTDYLVQTNKRTNINTGEEEVTGRLYALHILYGRK